MARRLRFRPNVAAILRRADGRILIGERSDAPGCWQFPQGGRKRRETPEQALARELMEELALAPASYRCVEQRGPYRYRFADGYTKAGFDGQEQAYFLLDLIADDESAVNVATAQPEFRAVRWVDPREFELDWLPAFKRETYRQVLRDFFGVML
ncbi:MAG: NUDIX domain-containing protein [Verrucomicrobia bacterium]|nr:NUDIX domain-containing protein [Verrucomicrobiota bacterium]